MKASQILTEMSALAAQTEFEALHTEDVPRRRALYDYANQLRESITLIEAAQGFLEDPNSCGGTDE